MKNKTLLITSLIILMPGLALAQSLVTEFLGSAANDEFGNGVACYGPALVVGAPGKAVTALNNVGGASLYLPASAATSRDFPLSFTPAGGELFGYFVTALSDVSGDSVRDYAISAPGGVNLGNGSHPTVFVYADPGAAAISSPISTIVGPIGSSFGSTIIELADTNSDNKPEIAIGAPDDSSSNGAIYLYDTVGPSLISTATGTLSERIGSSLATLSPNANVASGLPGLASGGPDYGFAVPLGRVNYFDMSDAHSVANITGTNTAVAFGFSLANVGDIDNDGFDDLLVGAPARNLASANAGHVYLFSGAILHSVSIQPSDALCDISTGAPSFGYAIAGIGDAGNTGTKKFAIAAPQAGANQEGLINVYSYTSGSCSLITSFTGSSSNEQLGISLNGTHRTVANNGCDLTADGTSDFVAGSRSDAAGTDAGSAVIFGDVTPTPIPTATPTNTPAATATRTPVPLSSATLRGNISASRVFSANVQYNTSLAGKGCSSSLLGRIELNSNLSDVFEIAKAKPRSSATQFLAFNLPDVQIRNCIRPILQLLSITTCGSTEVQSNVAALYLNCSNQSAVSTQTWINTLQTRISSSREAALHRRNRKPNGTFRKLTFKHKGGPNIQRTCK